MYKAQGCENQPLYVRIPPPISASCAPVSPCRHPAITAIQQQRVFWLLSQQTDILTQ